MIRCAASSEGRQRITRPSRVERIDDINASACAPWAIGSALGGHTAVHPDLDPKAQRHLVRARRVLWVDVGGVVESERGGFGVEHHSIVVAISTKSAGATSAPTVTASPGSPAEVVRTQVVPLLMYVDQVDRVPAMGNTFVLAPHPE